MNPWTPEGTAHNASNNPLERQLKKILRYRYGNNNATENGGDISTSQTFLLDTYSYVVINDTFWSAQFMQSLMDYVVMTWE
jgi:hypothetical protein